MALWRFFVVGKQTSREEALVVLKISPFQKSTFIQRLCCSWSRYFDSMKSRSISWNIYARHRRHRVFHQIGRSQRSEQEEKNPHLKYGFNADEEERSLHPVDLFGGLHSTYGLGAGQKMTVEKKMNILAGDCGAEETEQQDWSPVGKTKAGAKSGLPPIIFSGLIRWEADLGPCGFCRTTMHIKIVSDHQAGIFWP